MRQKQPSFLVEPSIHPLITPDRVSTTSPPDHITSLEPFYKRNHAGSLDPDNMMFRYNGIIWGISGPVERHVVCLARYGPQVVRDGCRGYPRD
jgi:hypothetical protein